MVVTWNDDRNENVACARCNCVAGALAKMSAWVLQENTKIKLITWILFFIFLLCSIIYVCLPYYPPCQADTSASILKFHSFPSLKTKQKCVTSKLPCEAFIYNSLSFVNFCQIPLLLRGGVQFHKFFASLSSMASWRDAPSSGIQVAGNCHDANKCFAAVALGRLKILSDYGVINIAGHGSDGIRNMLCITSAVMKLWNNFIMGLKYSINHSPLLVRNLAVRFLTWLINKALAWMFFNSLSLLVSTMTVFYHIVTCLTKKKGILDRRWY